MPTRRTFLHAVALSAAGVAVRPAAVTDAPAESNANQHVRRNFYSLDPNGPEVAALRAGVKAMRTLSSGSGETTNAKSWGYQRGIHRFVVPGPSPLPTAWNTCIHHGGPGPGFLSWHRAYLYHFEKICRVASGDTTFTLPYWNYDLPGQNVLPLGFRDPASMDANPLYYDPRGANDGLALDPGLLGAQSTIGTVAFPAFESALEGCHDTTHGAIGGHMAGVSRAALDPIFYLHHSNIDRCWRHWQLSHLGSGIDPSPLPAWWTTSWTFFDETGAQVQMTGEQAEHTTKLGYVYDDEPAKWRPWRPRQVVPLVRNLCVRIPSLCRPIEIRVQRPWPIPVDGPRPAPLPIRLPAADLQAIVSTKRQAAGALDVQLLALELVIEWVEGSPVLVAEARPLGSDGGWIRAGAASGFAVTGERDTIRMDVTRLLDRLDAAMLRRDLEWRVRFTSGRLTADGREAPLPANAPARARIFAARLAIPEATRR
jgi:hypothetical protein